MRLQPCCDRVASDANDANDVNVANDANAGEYHHIEERRKIVESDLEDCGLEKRWERGGLDRVFLLVSGTTVDFGVENDVSGMPPCYRGRYRWRWTASPSCTMAVSSG
jgi:hypothetical protein